MNNKTIYRLLKKFFKNGFDIGQGITFDMEYNESTDKIYLTMNNPNDASFNRYAILGVVDYKINQFFESLGIDYSWEHIRKLYKIEEIEEFYISRKLKSETTKVLRNITELVFPFEHIEGTNEDVIILVGHLGFDYEISGDDRVTLFNYVRPMSASWENGKHMDIVDAVGEYRRYQRYDKYHESETNYQSIDNLLNENPLVADTDWQVNATVTIFTNQV